MLYLGGISPAPDIIISQNGSVVVSRYKDDHWDLNPYSTSPNKEPIFSFPRILKIRNSEGTLERKIIDEMKSFLILLLYVYRGGRFGRISVQTFRRHFYSIAKIGRFCIKINKEDKYDFMRIRDVFSNARMFHIFLSENPDIKSNRAMIDTINTFRTVSQKHLGFKVANIKLDEKSARNHHQHPVIPAGIYLTLVNKLSDEINFFVTQSNRLVNFISEFNEVSVGKAHHTQKSFGLNKNKYRLTTPELIKKHQLTELFSEKYKSSTIIKVIGALMRMQYICLHTIILYTGMRISEALNMPFNCISEEILTPEIIDDSDGSISIESETINVIYSQKMNNIINKKDLVFNIDSYTTKFTGIKEHASWLANEDVIKAIRVLQAINLGMGKAIQKDFSDTLFVCPNHLRGKSRLRTQFKSTEHQPEWYKTLILNQEDLDILITNSSEEKLKEGRFILGKPWPLSAHQFRRSLAFYAANSGFVSLPTLTVQFKHLASSMTKYYCRNFEKIKTIFGYYNPKTDSFDIPDEHTILAFKQARVAAVVDALVNEVVHVDHVLVGKAGNYIQRNRVDITDNNCPLVLLMIKKKTLEAVENGEIYYRETLLGGCTSVDPCDCRMLGEFTSCLSKACAVIKPKNVSEQITELSKYITKFESNSGEYQVVKEELDELISFHRRYQGRNV